jgi:hypothetical protein
LVEAKMLRLECAEDRQAIACAIGKMLELLVSHAKYCDA